MKLHDELTVGPTFYVGKRAPDSTTGLLWSLLQKRIIKPTKRWRASVELRRKIAELDDHLLRDAGLHESTYAAECKMRREHNILHPWL